MPKPIRRKDSSEPSRNPGNIIPVDRINPDWNPDEVPVDPRVCNEGLEGDDIIEIDLDAPDSRVRRARARSMGAPRTTYRSYGSVFQNIVPRQKT